ncbi:thiosulfate sulfurtransferase GlpE [Aggregatibacter actinomycetemcomitans]|uniref:thiosulfate sulfurtransferase GlpE n=1 Tax=Aggregatibacter actinomycetemcomitans TaxID=714 RepID=UPI00197B1CD4|nr:thiosulfate sulfurtransferase GlpE [Aggregatibacter actinomycetemcomitans]MBN6077675.1 thiosulfate sulfurtransferase GlpE [Aggregatibacter actinomycetemcomitans]
MTEFIEISPQQAWEMLQQDENAVLADVRDQARFNYSHAQGAVNLTELTWPDFEAEYDYDQPIVVSCYHGVSSRSVATFLLQRGYEKVYSVRGGFAGWVEANLPLETAY